MRNLKFIIPALAVLFAACSQSQKVVNSKEVIDSTNTEISDINKSDSLTAMMHIDNTVKQGSPVKLKFTVINNSDSVKSFCKWHTPFEPFISKYPHACPILGSIRRFLNFSSHFLKGKIERFDLKMYRKYAYRVPIPNSNLTKQK